VTITGITHLTVLEDIIRPCINILFSDVDHYFEHDDASLHYQADMRNFLNVGFLGHTGSAEYPPGFPDLQTFVYRVLYKKG
jgi:hypothetical protein